MWRSRSDRDRTTVTCIACGDSLGRSEAREYDKEGDRWDRRGKRFEHLCKDCHRGLSHQPRDGLEALLCAIEDEAEELDRGEFLGRYVDAVERRADEAAEDR